MSGVLLTRRNNHIAEWLEHIFIDGGVVLVDKPLRWTSFDVVAKLRRLLKIKRIGHAGTLDPLATGLLIVCCGKATKQVSTFQELDKEYDVNIKLGAHTANDDSETPETDHCDISHLTQEQILSTIHSFTGTIEQYPPAYSAIHRNGQRLYRLARQGKIPHEIPPRTVTIYSIKVASIELPYVRFVVRCSKGTYIRALARDIGEVLGVGAYVKELRRLAIGPYHIRDAFSIEELAHAIHQFSSHANVSFNQ